MDNGTVSILNQLLLFDYESPFIGNPILLSCAHILTSENVADLLLAIKCGELTCPIKYMQIKLGPFV